MLFNQSNAPEPSCENCKFCYVDTLGEGRHACKEDVDRLISEPSENWCDKWKY